MKEKQIEKKIDVWKEIFKAVMYAWILEISSTFARLITKGFDSWAVLGICGIVGIGVILILIYIFIEELIKKME